MMSAARIAVQIRRAGQIVVLRRDNVADVNVPAFVRDFKPEELAGALIQGDRLVRIGCAAAELAAVSWPVPPMRGDTIVIAGEEVRVQAVKTLTVNDVDCEWVMQVRG